MTSQFFRESILRITPEQHRAAVEASREITSKSRAEAEAIIAKSNGQIVPLFPSFIKYPPAEFFEAMPGAPLED